MSLMNDCFTYNISFVCECSGIQTGQSALGVPEVMVLVSLSLCLERRSERCQMAPFQQLDDVGHHLRVLYFKLKRLKTGHLMIQISIKMEPALLFTPQEEMDLNGADIRL